LSDLGWFIWLDRHMAEGIGMPRLPGFDSYDDTVARWEERTGRDAADLAWHQVLAGLGFAAVMVRLSRLLVEFDLFPTDSDFEHTNPACTLLAAELDRLGAR
jgi:aminoglycoside phosphotransferase (APT) family kinase protein